MVRMPAELPQPDLDDGVILLRAWSYEDVPRQLETFADQAFLRHSDWAPTTRTEALARLEEQESARLAGASIACAIARSDQPAMALGEVSLNGIGCGGASLGYWLHPDARGLGVMTRAVRLITRWAFDALSLDWIELTCGPDNRGSRGVAERAGFTFQHRLSAHTELWGHPRDTLVYRLDAPVVG